MEQQRADLIDALGKFWLTLKRYGRKKLAEANYDLTFEQVVALQVLKNDEGLRIKELAERTERDSTTTSRMIDGLEKRNLVIRVPDPQDNRQRMIYLSRGAKERLADLNTLRLEMDKVAFQGVGRDQVGHLIEVVQRLITNLEKA